MPSEGPAHITTVLSGPTLEPGFHSSPRMPSPQFLPEVSVQKPENSSLGQQWEHLLCDQLAGCSPVLLKCESPWVKPAALDMTHTWACTDTCYRTYKCELCGA